MELREAFLEVTNVIPEKARKLQQDVKGFFETLADELNCCSSTNHNQSFDQNYSAEDEPNYGVEQVNFNELNVVETTKSSTKHKTYKNQEPQEDDFKLNENELKLDSRNNSIQKNNQNYEQKDRCLAEGLSSNSSKLRSSCEAFKPEKYLNSNLNDKDSAKIANYNCSGTDQITEEFITTSGFSSRLQKLEYERQNRLRKIQEEREVLVKGLLNNISIRSSNNGNLTFNQESDIKQSLDPIFIDSTLRVSNEEPAAYDSYLYNEPKECSYYEDQNCYSQVQKVDRPYRTSRNESRNSRESKNLRQIFSDQMSLKNSSNFKQVNSIDNY